MQCVITCESSGENGKCPECRVVVLQSRECRPKFGRIFQLGHQWYVHIIWHAVQHSSSEPFSSTTFVCFLGAVPEVLACCGLLEASLAIDFATPIEALS